MSIDWRTIDPKDAVDIELPWEDGPLNELGERCPWPWDPQQLDGAPLGQYHCPYCGGMQLAGQPHLDYDDEDAAISEGYAIASLLMKAAGVPLRVGGPEEGGSDG